MWESRGIRSLRVFRAVLGNRDLRRVVLAFVGYNATEYAAWIAILVYAYGRGGTTEAGLVAIAQLVPSAVGAPFLALLADRHRPARVLAWGYVAQAAGMGVTGVAIGVDSHALIVYGGAIFTSTALTLTRPVQSVIAPSLARSPDELTATNVVCSWVESASAIVGSVLTGVLLAVSGADVVFAVFAVTSVISALLVFGVAGPAPAPSDETESGLDVALGGFTAVRDHAHLRPIVGLLLLDAVLLGALDVLFVVLALDVLGLGDGWVGYLNAAFAAGGIAGGAVAVTLVGRRHLARPIGVGTLICAASFFAMAIWPSAAAIVVLLAASGMGRVLLDVAGRTLLQRTTPTEVLGRVFGVLEGLQMVGLAIGTALIPPLVALGGADAALAGTGLVLAVVLVLAARPLLRVDRGAQVPVVEISLLRSMELFAALPAPALEGVARALEPLELPAGHGRHPRGRRRRPLLRDRRRRGRGVAAGSLRRPTGPRRRLRRDRAARGDPADGRRHRDHGRPALRARQGAVRHRRRRLSARGAGRGRPRHARPRGPGPQRRRVAGGLGAARHG